MKWKLADLLAFSKRPDQGVALVLITGEDGAAVATRRADLVLALTGPGADADMRLARLSGADLRSDPALLLDAVKATGFFPGPRAVIIDGATDGTAPAFAAALAEWAPGDAVMVAGAGDLKAKGALRKLVESARSAYAVTLYADPPGAAEIADLCAKAGLAQIAPEARESLADWGKALDAGAFRRLIDTLALFKQGDTGPLTADEITALAPPQRDGDSDALMDVVAGGQVGRIAPVLQRMGAGAATQVCIAGLRHFRQLLSLVSDAGGPAQAVRFARPPIPFGRQDAFVRQASALGRDRIEKALSILIDTDLQLRSSSRAPTDAVVERALIRIAMLGGR